MDMCERNDKCAVRPGELYRGLSVLEPAERLLSKEERLRAMAGPLLAWYDRNARVLPWREDARPYRVWISEIMLQQTRVEAVKPYFERFMAALPDVAALSEVEEERLLKLWEGLGYYNRARNLKKAASMVVERFGGVIPEEREELLSLPGVGSYTAGAIASIAYGRPVPAVDGNVLRVISRVLESPDDITRQSVKTQMERDLEAAMPKDRAGAYNQGLIEIGAIVCVPGGPPRCGDCPLQTLCLASRNGRTGEIPVKAPKKGRRVEERTVLVIREAGRVAIRKRPDKGLLASLYELPSLDGRLDGAQVLERLPIEPDRVLSVERLPEAKHIFSHVEWHMTGYRIELKEEEEPAGPWIMAGEEELEDIYPLPNAFAAYRRLL